MSIYSFISYFYEGILLIIISLWKIICYCYYYYYDYYIFIHKECNAWNWKRMLIESVLEHMKKGKKENKNYITMKMLIFENFKGDKLFVYKMVKDI